MFGFESYSGGATILHALRATIGDEQFFSLLTSWIADNTDTKAVCPQCRYIGSDR